MSDFDTTKDEMLSAVEVLVRKQASDYLKSLSKLNSLLMCKRKRKQTQILIVRSLGSVGLTTVV